MPSAERTFRSLLSAAAAVALLFLAGCASRPPAAPGHERIAEAAASMDRSGWIEATLAHLTPEERIGQMVMSKAYGYYVSASGDETRRLEHIVREHKFGGIILMQGEVLESAAMLNRLQEMAEVPLLVGSDFEWGAAMRIRRTTRFPEAMALAATGDSALAFRLGEAIGAEARALGVHQVFAPVADVNVNPANPVINTRSFGEDPILVTRMARGVAAGLRSAGALATAKHFPGHGDTDVDSHLDLPRVPAARARMDSVELVPFRALIRDSIASVMVAHVVLPSIERGRAVPSTLSAAVIDGLLRRELGFGGLVVTDAMDMGALVKNFGSDSAAVRAVEAGVDILLIMPDEDGAVEAILAALRSGRISQERIDRSVRKILGAKWDLGLVRDRTASLEKLTRVIGSPEHLALSREIARAGVTVLRNDGVLPLGKNAGRRVLVIAACDAENYRTEIHRSTSPWPNEPAGDYFVSLLRRRLAAPPELFRLDPSSNALDYDALRKKVRDADVVICALYAKARSGSGSFGLPPVMARFLDSIPSFGVPSALVAFGSPYAVGAMSASPAVLCTYSDAEAPTEAAVEVLFGEVPARGRLPVTIPGLYPAGSGIDLRQSQLRRDAPQNMGFVPERLAALDTVMAAAVRDSAFPGAQLLVARDGGVVYQRAFGSFTYDSSSPKVASGTMYDLASVTKVIATTSVIMHLYEEGKLSLEDRVASYIPEFANHGKDAITLRNLLVHNAGLPAFKRLYLSCTSAQQALDSVYQTEMIYRTGDSTVYSDFDFILLGKIAERITGLGLDTLADSLFFRPLGMTRTMFRPDTSLRAGIAPTEVDQAVRHALVQGTVHDENAYILGGVSGHAGLFSTSGDLAVYMAMLMNGGSYGGRQYLKPETIAMFTERQGHGSSRALGWDTRSLTGYSSAGSLFGARTFGHTGFTGTSIWADPERKIFVILLTNRVYPTRNNRKIGELRPIVHDTVIRALR